MVFSQHCLGYIAGIKHYNSVMNIGDKSENVAKEVIFDLNLTERKVNQKRKLLGRQSS